MAKFKVGDYVRCKSEFEKNYRVTKSTAVCRIENVTDKSYILALIKNGDEIKNPPYQIFPLKATKEAEFENIDMSEWEAQVEDCGKMRRDFKFPVHDYVSKYTDKIESISSGTQYYVNTFCEPKIIHHGLMCLRFFDIEKFFDVQYVTTEALYGTYNLTKRIEILVSKIDSESKVYNIIKDLQSNYIENEIPYDISEIDMSDYPIEGYKIPRYMKVFKRTLEGEKGFRVFVFTNLVSAEVAERIPIAVARCLNMTLPDDVIKALMNSNFNELLKANDKYAEKIIKERIKADRIKAFAKISEDFVGIETKRRQEEINRLNDEYRDFEDRALRALKEKKKAERELFYYTCNKDKSNEFVEHLENASDCIVSLYSTSDGKIHIDQKAVLSIWMDSDWKHISNGQNYTFNNLNDYYKALLNDIFDKKKVKLIMEGKFLYNTYYKDVSREQFNRGSIFNEGGNGCPNPHISEYDCWSEARNNANKAMIGGDFVRAFDICQIALSSITLADSAVFNRFCNRLSSGTYNNIPCLIMENGEQITIQEYINRFIKAEEEKNNEEAIEDEIL